jgi:NADH-quinone oxidoreductase subunit I
MIVKRKELTFWERLYLPALAGGFRVTIKHFIATVTGKTKVTQQYPEEPTTVLPGYRGAPYLVRDQEGKTKCVSCQLCEFVCPPKAIKIIPPGPDGQVADRANAEKMPKEFEINMLRCIFCGFCQEVCPEEAIFLLKDFSLTGKTRNEMIYNKEKLLSLGGTHAGTQKWKHKLEEAKEQESFPVKV